MDGWPQTAEENMERLENAGFVEERGLSMCTNCGGKACVVLAFIPSFTKSFLKQKWAISRSSARRKRESSSVLRSRASTAERLAIASATVLRSVSWSNPARRRAATASEYIPMVRCVI